MEKVEQTGQESFSAISVNNTPTRKPSSSYESNFKIQPVAAIEVGLPLVAGAGNSPDIGNIRWSESTLNYLPFEA